MHAYFMLRGAAGSGNGGGGGGSNFPGTGFVSSTAGVKSTYSAITSGYVSIYYQYLAMVVPKGYILSASFSYTGGPQSYTVPSSITSLFIIACGAQGANYFSNYGGNGGCISIVKTVTPSTLFYVFVGGAGSGTSGGYNGGGGSAGYNAAGGGASDLRTDVASLATRCMYLLIDSFVLYDVENC